MRININKLKSSAHAVGHDKVFLLFPRYIEGHIVWLDYAWKRYQIQRKGILLPRYKKVTIGFMLYNKGE